ncbi:MAG: pseudouridine synthase [Spirochaetota bacterium]
MQERTCFGRYQEPVLAWTGTQGIAVVKPAGMHSAPGSTPDGSSLAEWVFQRFPDTAGIEGRSKGEGGLVHRLDRDTEGLVLFALTEGFFTSMAGQAAAGDFKKSYLALAEPGCGGLDGSRPLLSVPSGADDQLWMDALRRQDLERLAVMLSGSGIESRFRPFGPGSRRVACSIPSGPSSLKAWTRNSYLTQVEAARPREAGLLVDVRLTRGFRHQVRAHLAWVGLALEGDSLYGEGEVSSDSRSHKVGLRLLAYALSFTDPASGAVVRITLPDFTAPDLVSSAC